MKTIRFIPLMAAFALAFTLTLNAAEKPLFSTAEILDESTLDIKILQDWHVDTITGTTRQKLIEINVAEWWPGQDFRIPVRMIVPLKNKAKGFHITGSNMPDKLVCKHLHTTNIKTLFRIKTLQKTDRHSPRAQGSFN